MSKVVEYYKVFRITPGVCLIQLSVIQCLSSLFVL